MSAETIHSNTNTNLIIRKPKKEFVIALVYSTSPSQIQHTHHVEESLLVSFTEIEHQVLVTFTPNKTTHNKYNNYAYAYNINKQSTVHCIHTHTRTHARMHTQMHIHIQELDTRCTKLQMN